jgi:hypothetical protein
MLMKREFRPGKIMAWALEMREEKERRCGLFWLPVADLSVGSANKDAN